VYQVRESLSSNLPKHAARFGRKPARQFSSVLRIVLPAWLQIIGTIEDPADHVPFSEPYRVVPHSVQHSAVDLPVGLGSSRTRGTMSQ
jgi:hypothetical protein